MLTLLLMLLFVHALCDYPLQGDFLSRAKRRDGVAGFPWWLALSSHAMIHAGGVAIVTGSWLLGACEFACHWATDKAKCENKIGIVEDQVLHVIAKMVWVLVAKG